MKYIITLFALMIFCTVNSKITVQTKNDSIENKITQLDKKVNSIENNFSRGLIQEYKDLNNLYAIGFGFLITLFGVVFPIYLYFGQFKPAKDALNEAKLLLKKIEEDFEKSFEEHLNKSKYKIIDKAIESFELQEEQNFPDSIENLQKYQSETFTDKQIMRLIALIKRTDISSNNKLFLSARLIFQKSDEIEKHFVDLIRLDPKDKQSEHAISYLAKVNNKSHYDLITNVLISDPKAFEEKLYTFLYRTKSFAYDFFNHEKLIENLSDEQISKCCRTIENDKVNNFDLVKIRGTLMWKKYLEIQAI